MRDLPGGTVTFLFTDIDGSTKLLHELGAAAYGAALADHRRLLRETLARHGGVEVDTQGDALFIAFASARDALEAALEGQQALADGPIRVRMGLHTGTPHVDGEGYVGADVHLGARIAAAGHGGQVLVSRETRDLVADGFELLDLGEHRLKDFTAAQWIYQLGTQRFPPLKTISNTNLPRPASSFVGRETELHEVIGALRQGARLLTLTGPGGTGKTRLAIEAAAELIPMHRNGVFWIPLATVRNHQLVLPQIAHTLGANDELAEHIADREMLLVLDNFEQVVNAAPAVSSLLAACPQLRLIVTSRERLRIDGEIDYAVPPLAARDAIELFSLRARMEADADIAELCRRVDNLPLAVELAAARTNVLSPRQILERLSQRLDLLKGGRDSEARQHTLRATIEWSYDLLTFEEQELFARLAVFRGGCTLEAAEAVLDANPDILASLVDKSLVRHTGDRFWMLETIREYATERLEDSTDSDAVRRRHADHFLALAEEVEPHLLGARPDPWHELLERDHGNIAAALDYFAARDTQPALRLAGAVAEFWDQRIHHVEGLRRYASLLAADTRPTAARAKALDGATLMASKSNDRETAEIWAREALEIHRALGDRRGTAISLWGLGYLRVEAGDPAAAEPMLMEAVELLRNAGDAVSLRWVMRTLAFMYYTLGDLERARPLYEEVLQQAGAVGDVALRAVTLGALSKIAADDGRVADAIGMSSESVRLLPEVGDSLLSLSALCSTASVLATAGNAHVAAQLIGHASSVHEEAKSREPWVDKMNDRTIAEVRLQIGEAELAAATDTGKALTTTRALQLAAAALQDGARRITTGDDLMSSSASTARERQ